LISSDQRNETAIAKIHNDGNMKKPNLFQTFISIAIFSLVIHAQYSIAEPWKIKTGSHRNCNFCHISGSNHKDVPLWNQSATLVSPASQDLTDEKHKVSQSKVCLTCHDGTVARDQSIEYGEMGASSLGIDLKNSHPVSVDYHAAFSRKGRSFRPPSAIGPLKLFNGKVECSTCHDVHKSFQLRASKRDLCFQCHII
jgi:predicted CXXCH cytochrome family protein